VGEFAATLIDPNAMVEPRHRDQRNVLCVLKQDM